ncbi:MAG: efflux RND transporter periplasmic adaptor subunit [Desulfatiglandaceae bacterium]
MKKRLIIILLLVILLGVGALVYVGQREERTAALYYSGTIEATQAELSFQVSGRVTKVWVHEGESAENKQLLAELDQAELMARKNQALAHLRQAVESVKQKEAVLDLYRGTLPAEVARAEAAVRALKSNLDELETGYRGQEVEQARLAYESARITMEEARKDKIRIQGLFQRRIVPEKSKDDAELKYETASKEYERAKENLDLVREGFRKESKEAAKARLAEGQATLRQARSNLKRIAATEKEVDVAKAGVLGAEAALELAEIQLRYTQLTAPFRGIVVSRNLEPGEVVSPGREVLSLADLSTVDLKIFVDETEIGKVKPGQDVEVKIDTFPDKTYRGQVSFISPEGEFTPKIIQTRKERVKLVYLVKIAIPNPDLELKSGMPADAWFR